MMTGGPRLASLQDLKARRRRRLHQRSASTLMQRQREQQQLKRLESVPREEVPAVELSLQIICHQTRRADLSRLSVFMVVHLGLS